MDDMTDEDAKRADADTKFCSDCGATISRRAEICPQCGVRQIAAVAAGSGTGKVVKGCLVAVVVVVVGFVFVVVIGILAAIAIPKFANTKEKAYVAAMKSDLRNLVTAEESFFADSTMYTADTAKGTALGLKFKPSTGVSFPAIITGRGFWYAEVTHSQIPAPFKCAIAVNTTNTLVPTAGDGEPVCK